MANAFETVFKIAGKIASSFPQSIQAASNILQNLQNKALAAQNSIEGIDKASMALGTGVKIGAGLITGAAAITAGFVAAADAIAEVDILMQSLSKSVDMSVSDVEALGAFIKPMGMDFEAIIDLREEFINKMGESIGAGEMVGGVKDSFAILKLNFEEIKKLKPEQQWNKVTEAILKHGDAAAAQSAADILMGAEANKIFGYMRSTGVKSLTEITSEYAKLTMRTDEGREGALKFATAMNALKGFIGTLVSEFVGLTGGALTPVINNMVEWAKANKDLIRSKLLEFVKTVADNVKYLIDNFSEIAAKVKAFAIAVAVFITLTTVLKTIVLVATALNIVLAANPITLIIVAAVALASALAYVITRMGGVSAIWEKVKAAFASGVAFIKGVISSVDSIFANNPILNFLFPIIGIPRLIVANWSSITAFFSELWGKVVSFASGALQKIIGLINTYAPVNTIKAVWDAVFSYLSGLGQRMFSIGANILSGLIDGIKSKFDGLKSIWSTVNSWMPDFTKKKMDIHSPSRVMAGLGGHIVGGLTQGINAGFPDVKSSLNGGLDSAMPSPNSSLAPSSSGGSTLQLTQYITVGSGDAAEQAKQGAASGAQDVVKAYNDMMARKERLAF